MTATSHRPSRSIVSNRLNQFASLYDPDADDDAELQATKSEHSGRNPHIEYDTQGGSAHSYPLTLSHKKYSQYRETRLAKNPHCFYCGCKLGNIGSNQDHILPKSRGGGDWPANIVLTCLECNNSKDDATPAEWLEEIEAELAILLNRAERVRELIETQGLNWFTPTCSRDEAKEHTRKKVASTSYQEQFEKGYSTYSIVNQATGKPILHHLTMTEAVHYLEYVPQESPVELVLVAPMYRDGIGLTKGEGFKKDAKA